MKKPYQTVEDLNIRLDYVQDHSIEDLQAFEVNVKFEEIPEWVFYPGEKVRPYPVNIKMTFANKRTHIGIGGIYEISYNNKTYRTECVNKKTDPISKQVTYTFEELDEK